MRKLSLVILSVFYFTINIQSQTFTSQTKFITVDKPAGLDKIFMFKSIESSTVLEFQTNAASVIKWYKLQNGTQTQISNINYISPENNTGYVIDVDGVKTSFWVFDYSKYIPTFNTLTASDGDSPCENVKLDLSANIPLFTYENINGGSQKLDRKFIVSYKTIVWQTSNWSSPRDTTATFVLPNTTGIYVSSPLINTNFTISGDEYGELLNEDISTTTLSEYVAKAVKCVITTETDAREEKNENERPDITTLKGSAPLDIHFYSNPTPAVNTYLWEIFKESSSPFVARSAKDNAYTFAEAGTYKVKLTVSNQYCSYTDTIAVEVVESSLAVPKVFTPNGDGVQDEFRVAYKSIVEFEGIVYGRWGRKLFSWTDPAKGWDGKIGGKPAAIGPYYYLIRAKGSDGVKYKLDGCINLLR